MYAITEIIEIKQADCENSRLKVTITDVDRKT